MRFEFTQITQVWEHYFKSFIRVKLTEDEKFSLGEWVIIRWIWVTFILSVLTILLGLNLWISWKGHVKITAVSMWQYLFIFIADSLCINQNKETGFY